MNSSSSSIIIHPSGFFIIAFQRLPSVQVYFIFLALVYALTVLSNGLLICVVALDRSLHTPKFVAVVNLAAVDLLLNTCTIPGMVKLFLLKDNFVPFDLCLLQMFVYYTSISMESYALAILAYDRLVAICFPLRHNAVNTLRSMMCVVAAMWCLAAGVTAFSVVIVTRLSFCGELRVFSYFCDYAPVFRLACNDYSLHWSTASLSSVLGLGLPFLFILLSYAAILATVFRMKSLSSRLKALATCVEHVALVAVFYVPIFVIFTMGFYLRVIEQDQRVLSLSLASCLPPCINPIVYSLKTKEIKGRALGLVRKHQGSRPAQM